MELIHTSVKSQVYILCTVIYVHHLFSQEIWLFLKKDTFHCPYIYTLSVLETYVNSQSWLR